MRSEDAAYAAKPNIVDPASSPPVYVPAADEPVEPPQHDDCGTEGCCGTCTTSDYVYHGDPELADAPETPLTDD